MPGMVQKAVAVCQTSKTPQDALCLLTAAEKCKSNEGAMFRLESFQEWYQGGKAQDEVEKPGMGERIEIEAMSYEENSQPGLAHG